MTPDSQEPDTGKRRNRFVIQDDEIEITGRRVPSVEEHDEADRVFDRILKNRKQERS